MKVSATRFIFGILAATLLASAIAGYNVSAKIDAEDSASGQGSLPAETTNGDTRKRQFSFSAHRGADGAVKGNAVLHTIRRLPSQTDSAISFRSIFRA
jgi:hypothetical protein